ncbi:MAG: glycosyltransferase family 2 protein [Luteolibacter sp.]
MKLSILIVNWNSLEYLRKCLASIRATCANLDLQLVVVDGGSFDGCGEMVARDFPEVEFVQSADNIGFGRSNNLGFTKVKGDAVLLLNPDTELQDGAVQILLRTLLEQKDSGIIGARLLNSDRSLQLSSVHHLPTPLNSALDSDWLRRRWWTESGLCDTMNASVVEAVSGACMMMRAEVFRQVGGFSSRYFMYAEDMDLCLKVTRAGLKIYFAPGAVVLHHGGGSSGTQISKFSTVMIREALYVYMRQNHGFSTALLYKLLMALSALVRLSILGLAWLVSKDETRLAKAASMLKWWIVLRWSVGKEGWAKGHFLPEPEISSCIEMPSEQSKKVVSDAVI